MCALPGGYHGGEYWEDQDLVYKPGAQCQAMGMLVIG